MTTARKQASAPVEPIAASRAGRLRTAIVREIRDSLAGVHVPAAVAMVVATALLIAARHHGNTNAFRALFPALSRGSPFNELLPYLYWFSASVCFYLALPIGAAALTPGARVRATGLGLGDWRFGLAATALVLAVFLPVVFVASKLPAFAGHYPLAKAARTSWELFALYELGYAVYFVAWEYLFRGYLLFSLEPAMGRLAVFAQMMPFAIMHLGKPEAETFGSIVAGVVLGLLALRTRSCWYGALIHITVAVTMDVLAAWGTLSR
jgi:hypothetical protein